MRTAVFTYVYNNVPFIDVWLRHYTKYFKDIFIYNLEGGDFLKPYHDKYEFTEVVVKTPHEYKTPFILELLKKALADLLSYNEWVLYSDIDEIIFPNPARYTSFEHYIKTMNKPYLYCYAWEVIHEQERPIDWRRPLLVQRQNWVRQAAYDKPLLTSEVLDWEEGLHNIKGHDAKDTTILQRDEQDLYLVHLHRIDNAAIQSFSQRYLDQAFRGTDDKEKIPEFFKAII